MPILKDPRQERFCHEYLKECRNGTKAAISAGYSEKSAHSQACRLLKKDNILSRVRELQREQLQRLALEADWVILQLIEVYDRCMQAKPVMKWDYAERCMVETGEYQFDSKGALNALEQIYKHLEKTTDSELLEKAKEILAGVKSAF